MATPFKSCGIDGCKRSAHWTVGGRRGWCSAHYQLWYRNGSPDARKSAANGELLEWLEKHLDHGSDDCLAWPFSTAGKGYGRFMKDGVSIYAHRWMCEQVNGAPPAGMEAAHSCGKGHLGCVNPRHLRWATTAENSFDRIAHGTDHLGEKQPRARLKDADIPVIRAKATTMRVADIAREYGVSRHCINDVIRRRSWAWMK